MNKGDLVMSISGTVALPSFLSVDSCIHDGFMGFKKIDEKLSKDYLYYEILHLREKLINSATDGGVYINLTTDIVKNFDILVPSIEEQKKISVVLSSVDEQIKITDNIIEKTKELKKGLMQKLFTQGIGHDRFKDTEIGRIPEEWEVKKLSEVSEFNNGKSHEQNISEFGRYIVVNSKFISTEGEIKKYTNENVCPLYKGDIVMVMSDLPNGKALGKCYLIESDNLYSLNQRICSLKAKEIDVFYLFYYLNRNKYFLKYDDGVKRTNLRKSEVLDCSVLIPCFNEQKQIASILSSVDKKIEKFEDKKEKFQELKRGLMQKLLTGKVRIKV